MNINFFALKEELVPRISELEKDVNLFYYKCGISDEEPFGLSSILNYTDWGTNLCGDHAFNDRFLVLRRAEKVNIREVAQFTGGIKYAIDQLENQNSIILEPGGVYKDIHLVHGCISTISSSPESKSLFKLVSKCIVKGFKKVGAFYVSEGAIRMNEKGGRLLTISFNSPDAYDLKL